MSCVPPWSSTFVSQITRVSWILMPAILVLPAVTGRGNPLKVAVNVHGLRFEREDAVKNRHPR